MEMKLVGNKRPIKVELGMVLYDGHVPDGELPSKEEIDAYIREEIRKLFPEKPEDYIPTTLEIVDRLAEMAEEAGVSIEH
jgi:hypothetical protein